MIGPRLSTDLQQTNRPAPSLAPKGTLSAPASEPGWQHSWEAPRAISEGRSGDALSWPPYPHAPLKRAGMDLGPSHRPLSPTQGSYKVARGRGGEGGNGSTCSWPDGAQWALGVCPVLMPGPQTSHSLPCPGDLPPSCFPSSQSSSPSQAWLPHCLYSHLSPPDAAGRQGLTRSWGTSEGASEGPQHERRM